MWECWHRLGDDAVAYFLGGWGQGGQLPSPRKILPPPRKIKEIFYFVGGPSPLQAIKLIYFFSSKMFQYLKKKNPNFFAQCSPKTRKIKIGKIGILSFSFDSAHCASCIKTGAKLRGGGVCISLPGKVPIFFVLNKYYRWKVKNWLTRILFRV